MKRTFIILVLCILVHHINSTASDERFVKNPMNKWRSLERVKRSGTPVGDQAATVSAMIERLIPGRSQQFVITVNASLAENGRDVFILDNDPDGVRISISGNTGVAAAMGFQYYAKIYGFCLFSWSGNQVGTLASPLPTLTGPVKVVANDYFRYYQNVCTVSYSSVWWNWTRWEQEIDWMALNGINLPLAFNGQEEIFRRVYLSLNFTQEDLDAFFTGPAFMAWGRMGNIDGWGGPQPESFYLDQVQLQHQILDRMRSFGMIPVLPAFSGHVPSATEKYYPSANVTRLDDWGNFNSTYCCTYFLDPRDQLFQTIGQSFVRELVKEFGTDHVYNCDTFNEMTPPSDDPAYITSVGQATYEAMEAVDPDAIWLMQGWLFLNGFWTPTLVKAYVTSVPIGRMIILDLFSENQPLFQNFESYYGQPFIWNMLQNFGGTKGIYGTINQVNNGPFQGRAFPNTTMVGTGLTMEGIEQNDVMYELMNEMSYLRVPVDLNSWLSNWAERRYGGNDPDASAAWVVLSQSALNCGADTSFHGQFVITQRPKFNLNYYFCYNATDFLPAWDSIIAAARGQLVSQSDLFHHDLVDITREALTIIATLFYSYMQADYTNSDLNAFTNSSSQYLSVLDDLETLLATDRRFLLGVWLESAKALSNSSYEKSLYEYNARNQITLWGPTGNELDYATKQYSGIVTDYYKPRWQLFIDQVASALSTGERFNISTFTSDVFNDVETPFTLDTNLYPTQPIGDPIAVAQQVYDKWRNILSTSEDKLRNIVADITKSHGSISGLQIKHNHA